MKFWQCLALTEMDEIITLAKLAEEVGFAGVTLADHLATPQEIHSRYPYSEDGKPMWEPHDAFPDSWVMIAAMAQELEPSELDSSEASEFVGDWNLTMDFQGNPVEMALKLADVSGKLGASIKSAQRPEPIIVTNISKIDTGMLTYQSTK